MMQFNKSLDWLKESDDENLLSDDELDIVEEDEELNEGLYVDPANYGKHNDLVDVVDKQGNPQKMTQATYNKNKGSDEFKDAPVKDKQDNDVDRDGVQSVGLRQLKKGKNYVSTTDYNFGPVEDLEGIYEPEEIEQLEADGFIQDGEVVIPAGTEFTYNGDMGGGYNIEVNGIDFDGIFDDDEQFKPADQKEPEKAAKSSTSKNISSLKDTMKDIKFDNSSDASWNASRAYAFSQAFPVFAEMEKQGKDPVEEYEKFVDSLPVKAEDVKAARKEASDISTNLTLSRRLHGEDETTKKLQEQYDKARAKYNKLSDDFNKQIPDGLRASIDKYEQLRDGDDRYKWSFANWYKKNAQAYHDTKLDGSAAASLPPVAGMDAIEM